MVAGLAAALVSCVCYGIASVLQAIGARRVESGSGVDPRLLVRVLRSMPFVGGLCLDTVGLGFNLVALRSLPLFTTQAVVNTNLAITALVSVPLLHARLAPRDKGAVAAVVGGLIMLGFSSGAQGHGVLGTDGHVALLVTAVVLSAAALIVGNVYKKAHPALLGAMAGFLFGLFGIAVRVVTSLRPAHLVTDPAAYAAVIASVTGFLFFTAAVQRGSVTAATAALVIGETAVPALVGLIVLGDTTRAGFAPLGVLGFLLAVGGALLLSRFGEPAQVSTPTAAPVP